MLIVTATLAIATIGTSSGVAEPLLRLEGYIDLRGVVAPDETSWLEGGLGKTRYGGRDSIATGAEIAAELTIRLSGNLEFFSGVRLEGSQPSKLDALEAYLSYRADFAETWRVWARAGAFFPPVSLENDQINWAGTWTLTPSAINTWIGEEVRTLGIETRVEWRGDHGRVELTGAVFGANDPAGVLLAYHGWTLHDRPTGLFESPRLPDSFSAKRGRPGPFYTPVFDEIDGRPGWYVGAAVSRPGIGRVALLRYDNEANPRADRDGVFAWETDFWSLGVETTALGLVLKAQAISGETTVAQSPEFVSSTEFASAYVLAGKSFGGWRLAGRVEWFETRETEIRSGAAAPGPHSEDGRAAAVAVFWRATDAVLIGAELLHVDSDRTQRLAGGEEVRSKDTQGQMSLRVFY